MFGKSIIKIFDYLEHQHEIRFMFEGKEYNFLNQTLDDFIQLEIWVENDNKFYEDICIASEKSKSAFFIDVKCFNGKSFMEIERFIEVTKIF